jgi:8-oxo-dGTP pyrophosphatase MutT (NUDIX family)
MVYRVTLEDVENLKAQVHQDLKWVAVDELKNYQFPPADVDIIAYLEQNF